ncbi:MAG TPA: hypothetical protein VGT61_05955 [Thermomicrobiales bacterium]|nr:hypothetical protein [Thermomicrobiales bacterium]
MSLVLTMAQQMMERLTPEERLAAARDVALEMFRGLSPEERADLATTLLRALVDDLSPEERRTALAAALTIEETNG